MTDTTRVTLPVAIGRVLFHTRNGLFPIAFLLVAFASRPRMLLGSARWDLALDALGLLVALAGQALRVAVIGLVYIRRGGKGGRIYAASLVTGGFFAHSRNPLYVGNMLVYFGLFLMLNSMAGYLAGIPFFLLAYLCITSAEEAYLASQFGEQYEAYRRRVPRFWPRWQGLRATIREMRFDWRRVVRKEYGSTFTWLTTALAIFVWQTTRNRAPEEARALLWVAVAAWVPVIFGYAAARVMKKTGVLKSA